MDDIFEKNLVAAKLWCQEKLKMAQPVWIPQSDSLYTSLLGESRRRDTVRQEWGDGYIDEVSTRLGGIMVADVAIYGAQSKSRFADTDEEIGAIIDQDSIDILTMESWEYLLKDF
jgi:hypothetical protein